MRQISAVAPPPDSPTGSFPTERSAVDQAGRAVAGIRDLVDSLDYGNKGRGDAGVRSRRWRTSPKSIR